MHRAIFGRNRIVLVRWVPPDQNSVIEIYQCGHEVCGRIATLNEPLNDSGEAKVDLNNPDEALRELPILFMELLTGFSLKKVSVYSGGRVYNPCN